MAISQNSIAVIKYLQGLGDANVTSADVAEAMGLEKRQVDGIFTSALCRKGLGMRVPAEVELDDGTHMQVKFLKLTDAGVAFDPDASSDAE